MRAIDINLDFGIIHRTLFSVLLVVCLAILFETLQQQYFIQRFNIREGVSFFDVLYSQSVSWASWFVTTPLLLYYCKRRPLRYPLTSQQIIRYACVITSLIIISIVLLSFVRMVMSDQESWNTHLFVTEYIRFFAFQKTPIFTLSYVALIVVINLHYKNRQLENDVRIVSEINYESESRIQEMLAAKAQQVKSLTTKIGNRRKVIPISDISWIEADDYCVRLHTLNGSSHTMRTSLKALGIRLPSNFIRVHRGSIVNMNAVKELVLKPNASLILHSKKQISISRTYLKKVKNYVK